MTLEKFHFQFLRNEGITALLVTSNLHNFTTLNVVLAREALTELEYTYLHNVCLYSKISKHYFENLLLKEISRFRES